MCGSRKYPHSFHRRSLKIPRGRGVLKTKLLESIKIDWNFLRGEGVQNKNPLWGSIFCNYTMNNLISHIGLLLFFFSIIFFSFCRHAIIKLIISLSNKTKKMSLNNQPPFEFKTFENNYPYSLLTLS